MIINGKKLAGELLADIKQKVSALKEKPTLAVIQVGDDPGSTSYINQKKKKGEEIGITVIHKHFPENTTQNTLTTQISQMNSDPTINGIIIQRPLPAHIDANVITSRVAREKDVDGFRADSPFTPPVALAVVHILSVIANKTTSEHVIQSEAKNPAQINASVRKQLLNKKIVILGRGETAGKPIAQAFEKKGIPFETIHSKTPTNRHSELTRLEYSRRDLRSKTREQLLKQADVIIACVGKERIISREDIKPGVILVGVGIHRTTSTEDITARPWRASLQGDFDEEEIKETVSFYTPTPGGVGPLTVAYLFSNLLERSIQN